MILAKFTSEDTQQKTHPFQLPPQTTPTQLNTLLNTTLNTGKTPYSFYINSKEIKLNLQEIISSLNLSSEDSIEITYKQQCLFKVREVTRCSSTLSGHGDAILCCAISPDGKKAASGSGDSSVRLWDLSTETPIKTLLHKNWVLKVKFSPDSLFLASGSMDNTICIWSTSTSSNSKVGDLVCCLKGHTKWITCLDFEPFFINTKSRLCSGSKDGTIRIWNIQTGFCEFSLTQHKDAISEVKWGGNGLIYTASRDRTIKVWSVADRGKLVRSLEAHGHWVNCMALNTDYALKSGPFDEKGKRSQNDTEAQEYAKKKYLDALSNGEELLVTGSDDFTLFLWSPSTSKKPLNRLTGHQQLINHVTFSPDGRYIASASFDKTVKLWSSKGEFLCNFRGHVSSVYQVCFSLDSSGSKDSTLKLWDLGERCLKCDLPGHEDEVYCVDWGLCFGESKVISGGKDRMIKFWRQ